MQALKCVLVGDGNVGKTSLMKTYKEKCFPETNIPTVFDSIKVTMQVDEKNYDLTVYDTAGQEAYDRLRPLTYPQTDVFLMCFSLVSRASYENVRLKWLPELKHHCRDVPIVLVGTKLDMRDENSTKDDALMNGDRDENIAGKTISSQQGDSLKKDVGALFYVECSAKTQTSTRDVFESAIRAVITPSKRKRREFGCALV
ncbi:ras-related C3 botulinum toxin substrate 2-like isoform X1 [Dreissena polymorpha]|uniref:Uncharacterized protein n=1 Tax=Dreissena polymorpha TaxID=45954 RepID=A0A9D4M0H7_DREPO|nr:ras-related C3 botulinum toxin substrate 2-like isoform X1 [Dreissena polymorpha]KAH3867093.1 hypothetical protein DPMN_030218 [Dreissena polymorpha]